MTVDGSMRWVPLTTIFWMRCGVSAGASAAAGAVEGGAGLADGPAGVWAWPSGLETASPRAKAGAARATRANRVMWLIQSSLALVDGGALRGHPLKFQKRFR